MMLCDGVHAHVVIILICQTYWQRQGSDLESYDLGDSGGTSSIVSELAPALSGHMPELRPVVVCGGLGRPPLSQAVFFMSGFSTAFMRRTYSLFSQVSSWLRFLARLAFLQAFAFGPWAIRCILQLPSTFSLPVHLGSQLKMVAFSGGSHCRWFNGFGYIALFAVFLVLMHLPMYCYLLFTIELGLEMQIPPNQTFSNAKDAT